MRIAALDHAAAVADLAELISLCAHLRAQGVDGDGAGWAATAALTGEGVLAEARSALRAEGDPRPLLDLARKAVDGAALERALAAHSALVR